MAILRIFLPTTGGEHAQNLSKSVLVYLFFIDLKVMHIYFPYLPNFYLSSLFTFLYPFFFYISSATISSCHALEIFFSLSSLCCAQVIKLNLLKGLRSTKEQRNAGQARRTSSTMPYRPDILL